MHANSSLPTQAGHAKAGADLSVQIEGWAQHAASMTSLWLSDEWQWECRPLANYVAQVDVDFAGSRRPLWKSGPACQAAPMPVDLPEPWPQAMFDSWHPAWLGLVEAWALDGTWLHPESHYNADQVLFSRDQGRLYIGCVDREHPAAPRRYRRDQDPHVTDIGVIQFPLSPYRALPYLAAGWPARDAMLITAGTAVIEACVHEALETFQESPGVPVWDPHVPDLGIQVEIIWLVPPPVTSLALPSAP